MSRVYGNMGDSGKLRFYELGHELNIQLLISQSHTSNGLAMEPGTREKKHLRGTQTLQQGKSHPSRTCRVPSVWRGGQKRLWNLPNTAGVAGGGRKGSTVKQSQKKHDGGASPRRYGAEHRRYYKGDVMRKTSRGPSAWRGVQRGNDEYPGWKVVAPTASRGGEVFGRKTQSRTNTTHRNKKGYTQPRA